MTRARSHTRHTAHGAFAAFRYLSRPRATRCRVVALSRCRVVALSRCRTVAPSHRRTVASSHRRVVHRPSTPSTPSISPSPRISRPLRGPIARHARSTLSRFLSDRHAIHAASPKPPPRPSAVRRLHRLDRVRSGRRIRVARSRGGQGLRTHIGCARPRVSQRARRACETRPARRSRAASCAARETQTRGHTGKGRTSRAHGRASASSEAQAAARGARYRRRGREAATARALRLHRRVAPPAALTRDLRRR
ncbi:D-alanyl-D-alanine carboxypeptidase family domain protein [Burkholderia pseudomallei]|nr:D-alanyl-D-alanine carboxypeptidase family domain protein [Burkholderia pseudomallei]KGD17222.1 D-alanyl-D-alanine carboxypeptidase family domain protein [Burkholderia pseudomallei]CAJ2891409.1 murein-DD-endopeptidase [Burkholderia pseudomallei]VBS80556.1 murein-DD-endopeptidase [Burkholderia pseudomallei]